LVIGNHQNSFGKYLVEKFKDEQRIIFLGPNYNLEELNNLRYYSNLYFHGHSVGGTNPSLLEAMGSGALICAHQNEFNSSILGNEAYYFSDSKDVTALLNNEQINKISNSHYVSRNLQKVKDLYLWTKIVRDYEAYFVKLLNSKEKK
jgi:glycosyltransferase involved in cell wall biosynthesis